MAEAKWLLTSGNGDWSDGANWSTAAQPTSSDTVLFDGTANGNVNGGDFTAGGTDDVQTITFAEEYTGNVGEDGNPLEVDCQGKYIVNGSGNYYIAGDIASVGMRIRSKGFVQTGCRHSTFDTLIRRGHVVFTSPATVQHIHASFSPEQPGSVKITSAAIYKALVCDGGTLDINNEPTAEALAGDLSEITMMNCQAVLNPTGGTIARILNGPGSVLRYLGTSTITELDSWGNATFEGDSRTKTVTTVRARTGALVMLPENVLATNIIELGGRIEAVGTRSKVAV